MNKLKVIRIDRGLSQHELAAASQVPRFTIQLLESGIQSPNKDQRAKLAAILGVTEEALFPLPDKISQNTKNPLNLGEAK